MNKDGGSCVNDEIKTVDVRTKWPHEAHGFTPWLAKNLDLLGSNSD